MPGGTASPAKSGTWPAWPWACPHAKPAAAPGWLPGAFGFTSPDPLPEGTDPLPETACGHPWIEIRLGNSSLMIFKLAAEPPAHP